MPEVFISYSRQDQALAGAMAAQFAALGVDARRDRLSLETADDQRVPDLCRLPVARARARPRRRKARRARAIEIAFIRTRMSPLFRRFGEPPAGFSRLRRKPLNSLI